MDRPHLAKEIMVSKLVTLAPETHVSQGISCLLRHNISGAPVVDDDHNYLGVFSEKCCLKVLSFAEQLVGSRGVAQVQSMLAREFMATRLITLTPEMDVFDAIGYLLKNHISGASVLGPDGVFLGIFSEKTSMKVLVDSAYDQLPTSKVGAFMNTETERVIADDTKLSAVIKLFLETPYRRLPVLSDGKLVGQVSRRDALRVQNHLAQSLNQKEEVASFMDREARTITAEMDLFSIAHLFLNTPYRRLPVLEKGKLVGQVSRRDVLYATHDSMALPAQTESKLLYLSSLIEQADTPFN